MWNPGNISRPVWDTFQFTWNCPCRQLMTPTSQWYKSCISGNESESIFIDSSVNIWHLGSYDDSLYVNLQDFSDAIHQFLVDITSSKVYFISIFVPRDTCNDSETSVHARSLVTRLLVQTNLTPDCTYLWPLLANGLNGVWCGDRALVCRNRSKIDLCGPKGIHDHGDDISYFVTWDVNY